MVFVRLASTNSSHSFLRLSGSRKKASSSDCKNIIKHIRAHNSLLYCMKQKFCFRLSCYTYHNIIMWQLLAQLGWAVCEQWLERHLSPSRETELFGRRDVINVPLTGREQQALSGSSAPESPVWQLSPSFEVSLVHKYDVSCKKKFNLVQQCLEMHKEKNHTFLTTLILYFLQPLLRLSTGLMTPVKPGLQYFWELQPWPNFVLYYQTIICCKILDHRGFSSVWEGKLDKPDFAVSKSLPQSLGPRAT